MIRTILVAIDASPRAAGVVAAAVEFASHFGAQVVLLRVIAIPQDFPAAGANAPDALPAALEQNATRDLQRLVAGRSFVRAEPPLVYPGQPWRAIVERASQLAVDLIVVGSHGFSGWDRILGTTASKVADRAGRNVLVVHDPEHKTTPPG